MSYYPRRTRNHDLAVSLLVCPECLGDLEFRSDFSGEYHICLQCNERMEHEPGTYTARVLTFPRHDFPYYLPVVA